MQKKRYKVDYGGQKNFLAGAKDYYNAGERVRVCYNFIATDTRYFFFVDGAPFNPGFDAKEGFIIEFMMPEHDVSIKIKSENTMLKI